MLQIETKEPEKKLVYRANARQAMFHKAPERFKLYGGAMGGGKTWALCAEAIRLSSIWDGNVGYICRNTRVAFMQSTFITLDKMLAETGWVQQHYKSSPSYYLLKNGSYIFYGGLGDDIRSIENIKSREYGWFAIDEASETPEDYFYMLSSRLRLQIPGIRYFGILGTNPDPGWLKRRFIDQKLEDHIFIPALPRDNPNLPPDYIKQLEQIFPPEWQKRFIEGDWTAFEGVNNVFPYTAIKAAIDRTLEPGEPIEIGVDVARYGDDESVIVLRQGGRVTILKTLRKTDTMTTAGHVVQSIQLHGPLNTKIDSDGIGAGPVDRLKELGYLIHEIHGGGKAINSERYENRKAEIYWGFRERLIVGDVDLPDDLELQAQLASCEYKIKSSGKIEIVSKEDMKKKGIKSPDRAEAVIYAFADTAASSGFSVLGGWDDDDD